MNETVNDEREYIERNGKRYVEILDPQEEEFRKIKIWPEKWDENEEIQGVFLKKRSNIGPNHQNVYRLKNEEGCFDIWGTTGLDNRFNSKKNPIPLGAELVIIYKGEKPVKPPHKPFKVFKIYILEKSNGKEETKPQSKVETPLPKGGHDKEAQEHIKWLRNEMHTRKVEVNPENILAFAKYERESFNLTEDDIARIGRQLQLEQAILEEKKKKERLV